MKFYYIIALFLCLNSAIAQESEFIMCETEMNNYDPESANGPCVEYFDYFYNYLDHVQIHKPVFHFVNYDYMVEGVDENDIPFSLPALNFICIDDPNDPLYVSENNAFKIAKDIIYWANRTASMLEPSLPGGSVLPNNDLKLRYTDIENCNDIIIIPNGGDIQNIPGVLNFHIINTSNTSFSSMGVMGPDQMQLKNIGNKITHPNKSFNDYTYGPLANHEIGHDFGLCHAQADGNMCNDIPNDQICASGNTDPACSIASIVCDSDGLNNTMISGSAKQRGFTPCQFTEAFLGMTKFRAWRTTYLNDCLDIIIDKPQETTYLDCELYVCSKLIVKTGSELVLRGNLVMNENSEILVEKGARFILEKGRIAGKIPTPGYWKGINLSDGSNGWNSSYFNKTC